MSPKKKGTGKKPQLSQYNASFSMHYDVILQKLITYFYNNETIDSDSKYGLANYCILRTLFDYVDEVVKDYTYTPEQLVKLIEEHDFLKTKFEKKLLLLTEIKQEQQEKVMLEIESE